MKKLLCFLLCISLLHGCENKKEVENKIPDFYGFKTKINTIINDVKISAEVEYEFFDKLVLTFYLPQSVCGMKIELINSEYNVIYEEMTFCVPEGGLPYSAICNVIMDCAENIKLATCDNNLYTFVSKGHMYNIEIDETTKEFVKVIVDETYTIEFEEFEYIMGHTE